MGFLDDMFGMGAEFQNPNKAFGEQMPAAYRQYFADIENQLGGALAKKQGMDELRKNYFSQIWEMRKAGIEQALERARSKPSVAEGVISQGQEELDANLDKIRDRSQSDAIRRGLGSSTVGIKRVTSSLPSWMRFAGQRPSCGRTASETIGCPCTARPVVESACG